MEAVIYARLGLRELNLRVLEQRVATCRSWGEQNDFRITAIFTDRSCSGAHLDRKGFTKLCEFVMKRHLPIIITDLSQLTTSVRDSALIADVFDELGIHVYSVREGLICNSHLSTLGETAVEANCKSSNVRRHLETPRSGIPKSEHASMR